jgi:hypothetical protein
MSHLVPLLEFNRGSSNGGQIGNGESTMDAGRCGPEIYLARANGHSKPKTGSHEWKRTSERLSVVLGSDPGFGAGNEINLQSSELTAGRAIGGGGKDLSKMQTDRWFPSS